MDPQMQKEQNRSNGGGATGADASGVVEAWIGGGVDTAEAVLSSCVSILEEARTQFTQRVAQTLDWAEGFPRGFFSFARKVNEGGDRIAAESIRAGNRVVRSIFAATRRAGDGARSLVSVTASSIVGADGQRRGGGGASVSAA
jgi:hypothetical protein